MAQGVLRTRMKITIDNILLLPKKRWWYYTRPVRVVYTQNEQVSVLTYCMLHHWWSTPTNWPSWHLRMIYGSNVYGRCRCFSSLPCCFALYSTFVFFIFLWLRWCCIYIFNNIIKRLRKEHTLRSAHWCIWTIKLRSAYNWIMYDLNFAIGYLTTRFRDLGADSIDG